MDDITELIFQLLPSAEALKILDAGCGVGYSLIQICSQSGHSGLGISLSKKELEKARESRDKRKLGHQLQFRELSFDDDLGGPFDAIFSMESLKHAPSWRNSFKNLAAHLKVGGSFFVLEDYAGPKLPPKVGRRFQELWSVPELYTEKEFLTASQSNQLHLIKSYELDQALPQKSAFLSKFLASISRLLAFLSRKEKWKHLIRIYEGGLWMDYLYAKGHFRYRLFQFEKRD